jgi:hypothetical protein
MEHPMMVKDIEVLREDNDGFDLRVRTKDNILAYNTHKPLFVKTDIKEIFLFRCL